jgi:hypothetical protein
MPEIKSRQPSRREQAGNLDYVTIVLVGVIIVLAVIGAAWLHLGR